MERRDDGGCQDKVTDIGHKKIYEGKGKGKKEAGMGRERETSKREMEEWLERGRISVEGIKGYYKVSQHSFVSHI